jgi:hypothetical protein
VNDDHGDNYYSWYCYVLDKGDNGEEGDVVEGCGAHTPPFVVWRDVVDDGV